MPRLFLLIAVGFAFACVGCTKDGYAELGLVPVSGTVTLDGQPLSGAKVSFEGEDKRSAIGTTDAAGHYTLMYDSQTPGATPGPKIVRITKANAEVEGGGTSEGVAPSSEPIPARYNRQSELKADVKPGTGPLDFKLTSAK